jgi:hypothetical protein
LFTREIACVAEQNKCIKDYVRRYPKIKKNPKAMALLHSYKQPHLNNIIKLLPIIGLSRVEAEAHLTPAEEWQKEQEEREQQLRSDSAKQNIEAAVDSGVREK